LREGIAKRLRGTARNNTVAKQPRGNVDAETSPSDVSDTWTERDQLELHVIAALSVGKSIDAPMDQDPQLSRHRLLTQSQVSRQRRGNIDGGHQ